MSENLPSPQNQEEVDLGQLFNAIGGVFNRFLKFIVSIFKGLFVLIIYGLKPIVRNYKVIGIVLFTCAILGFIVQKIKPEVYYSEMLVKPYFESKYKLVSNINHYNSLIDSKKYKELSNVFEIDTLSAEQLLLFEVMKGPETENELLKQFDAYKKSIDSVMASELSYEDFVENRDLYSSDIFSIYVESTEDSIFRRLENGVKNSFKNEYSEKLLRIRDETIDIKTDIYNQGLEKVDTLQKIYIEVLQEESKRNDATIGINGSIPLLQEKSTTKEYDLFTQGKHLRDSIGRLKQLKIEESTLYDIVSGFQEIGTKKDNFLNKYFLVFPLLAFILICLGYFTSKAFKFIKEYDA